MSAKMAAAGADALLVVTPCFYKGGMTNSALEAHFTKVCLNCYTFTVTNDNAAKISSFNVRGSSFETFFIFTFGEIIGQTVTLFLNGSVKNKKGKSSLT